MVAMPSERHMSRQFEWKNALQRYGANVELEKTVRIKGARVIVDVFAKVEGKTFLIEIGDINDDRKHALLEFYSEKPNIEFIHEDYTEDKIHHVLEQIGAYLNTEEYKAFVERRHREKMKEKRKGNIIKWLIYTILSLWLVPSVILGVINLELGIAWFLGWIFLFIMIVFLLAMGVFTPMPKIRSEND